MLKLRSILLALCLLTSSIVNASGDDWQFVLTPVIWNPSVEARLSDGGDSGSGGDIPIEPEYQFFTLDNLDGYLSLKFEASQDRFGILFDSLKVRYEDTAMVRSSSFSVGTELGYIELSARYQPFAGIDLDIIGGVRRAFLDIDQTSKIGANPSKTEHYSFDWTDPLIGLRYQYSISDRWHAWFRGDIGGFDVSTQRVINAVADIQYIVNTNISVAIGYRYFEIDFKEGDILYDVTLNGLQLSVGFHF